jgi:phospholipid/cholesterol/gamma-HCH transport system permease protein
LAHAPTPDSTDGATPRGDAAFAREGGALVLRLAGRWSLHGTRPASADARAELASAAPSRLVVDARGVEEWDTSLLAYLTPVLVEARERNVPADLSALPDGARRLLELAQAVPERAGARRQEERPGVLARIGESTLAVREGGGEVLRFIGEVTLAFGRMLRLRARFQMSELGLVIQQTGPQALPIVTLIAFLVGLILAFMGAVQLERFGASIYVADLVGLGMTREMGAMMTAIVMAGRTGAAFAAQLGTMKVTEEIDALSTFGISPLEFLVLPRMLALCLMMPLLCVYANFWGIVGGVVVATGMLDLSLTQFLNETYYAVTVTDFMLGVVKSVVFGALIALSGCLRGMQTQGSASAVGDSATAAVVSSIVLIVATDGLFAVVCNILGI